MKDQDKPSNAELLRYFTGDPHLDSQDEARIGAWIQAHYSAVPFVSEQERPRSVEWDTETELQELEAKIDSRASSQPEQTASPPQAPRERPARRRQRTRRRTTSPVWRAAAILALMAVSGLLAVSLWGDLGLGGGASSLAVREVTTDRGQRAQVRLADGSEVMLSVDSKMRIPEGANASEGARTVHLEGEAYFEVESDPDRPFRVHAGGTVSRVLGTAFSVRAYPDEEDARVVVEEGSVAVEPERAEAETALALTRQQMGRWSQHRPDSVRVSQNVDVRRFLDWKEGNLTFEGTPLREVIAQMERWYDLNVQLTDTSLESRTFTGTFDESTPVTEVLDTFTFATGLRYQKKGRTVVLRPATE